MQKTQVLLLAWLLIPSCSGDGNGKSVSDSQERVIAVSLAVYPFEASQNGETVTLPIAPGDISIRNLEKMYSSVEDYAGKLKDIYSFKQIHSFEPWGMNLIVDFADYKPGTPIIKMASERCYTINVKSAQLPSEEWLPLTVQVYRECDGVAAEALLVTQILAQNRTPTVVGRMVPEEDGKKTALFYVIVPSFGLFQSDDRAGIKGLLSESLSQFIEDEKEISEYLKIVDEKDLKEGLELGFPRYDLKSPPVADKQAQFVHYDQPPEPMGGYREIMKRAAYPESARRSGIEGTVIVKARIGVSGDIIEAEILRGINEALDSVALDAVKGTKFIPAKAKGEPVAVYISIPIAFNLSDDKFKEEKIKK